MPVRDMIGAMIIVKQHVRASLPGVRQSCERYRIGRLRLTCHAAWIAHLFTQPIRSPLKVQTRVHYGAAMSQRGKGGQTAPLTKATVLCLTMPLIYRE
jgi:hypothetical protein